LGIIIFLSFVTSKSIARRTSITHMTTPKKNIVYRLVAASDIEAWQESRALRAMTRAKGSI
jgi:hypothetical protein